MRRLVVPLIVLVLLSCGDEPDTQIQEDLFSGYYKLQVGAFQIYDVEDIQIQQNIQTKSLYELKVMATDSFRNEEEGYSYVISRYKRANGSQSWTPVDTWTSRMTSRAVVINEANVPFVRLITPLVKGQKWNGNEMNTLSGDDPCGSGGVFNCDQFEITAIGESFVAGSISYENTLTVTEENDPDILVKNDVRKRVYAKTFGLIYAESTVLNYCTTPPSCYGTQFVNTGSIYKQTLKESGLEK